MCSECAQGKHENCTGWSIDPLTDEWMDCLCPEPFHWITEPPTEEDRDGN